MSVTPPSSTAPIEPWEVLDLLTSLVQKSLVVYEEDEQGQGRYRLLETVRQYARDRLLEAGEAARVRARHLEFFLGWVQERPGWERLEVEHDNLRAALAWSQAQGHADLGLRLAGMLGGFWLIRGFWREGLEHLVGLLALPGAEARSAVRAWALGTAGRLAQTQDWGAARPLMEESLAIFRELDDKGGITGLLGDLGRVLTELGEYEPARALLEESLALSRELGYEGGVAPGNLALLALYQGEYEVAGAILEEILPLARAGGNGVNISWVLNCLARAAYEQEEYERAQRLSEEARTIAMKAGYQSAAGEALRRMGLVALQQGDAAAARALLAESLALVRELGEKVGIAEALWGLGRVARREGEHGAARALHRESLALYREIENKPGIIQNLEGMAAVAAAEGRPERAAYLFGAVERLREAVRAPIPPAERDEHEVCVVAVRTTLGEEAFAAAWAAGRATPLEEAVQYALRDSDA